MMLLVCVALPCEKKKMRHARRVQVHKGRIRGTDRCVNRTNILRHSSSSVTVGQPLKRKTLNTPVDCRMLRRRQDEAALELEFAAASNAAPPVPQQLTIT